MTTWTKSKGVLNDRLLVLRTCPLNIGPGPCACSVCILQQLHEAWKPPKIEVMSTFDLRKKTIRWEEEEDCRSQAFQSLVPSPWLAHWPGERLPGNLHVWRSRNKGLRYVSPQLIFTYLWCFGCERGIKDTIYILNIASFRVCKSLTWSWSSGWNMNMDESGVKLPRIHSHPHTPVVHKHGNEQASTCRRWLGSKWGKNQFHLPPITCTLFLSWVNLGYKPAKQPGKHGKKGCCL